jgi:hypothetical protein
MSPIEKLGQQNAKNACQNYGWGRIRTARIAGGAAVIGVGVLRQKCALF